MIASYHDRLLARAGDEADDWRALVADMPPTTDEELRPTAAEWMHYFEKRDKEAQQHEQLTGSGE
jgi:hypothetical protein